LLCFEFKDALIGFQGGGASFTARAVKTGRQHATNALTQKGKTLAPAGSQAYPQITTPEPDKSVWVYGFCIFWDD